MQKKPLRTGAILDKLHRGVVYTCIGVTLFGTYMLGERIYRYLTVTKPARQQKELEIIEGSNSDAAQSLSS